MSMLAAPDTITGPLRAEDPDRDTNPGNVWMMPRRACQRCTQDDKCNQGRCSSGFPDTVQTDRAPLAAEACTDLGADELPRRCRPLWALAAVLGGWAVFLSLAFAVRSAWKNWSALMNWTA